MSKKSLFLTIFFILLTVGFVVALYRAGLLEKRYKTISTVQPYRFINQDSAVITDKDMQGKVVLVDFFFTTCTTVCPPMQATMKKLYEEFKAEPNFIILSHTAKPDQDKVSVLKHYADSMGASSSHWMFLTGPKDSLYFAARKSYALDDQNNIPINPDEDFIHTQLFALVNKKGEVKKKVYESHIKKDIDELRIEIRKALEE